MTGPMISACILTFNSERTVEACLKSIQWVDEIVVVDSFSTDRTLEIVRQYTDKIHQRAWVGFREQFNFARQLASGQWILSIDSDEELSSELQKELQQVFSHELTGVGGYSFRRRTYYLGRWIDHGGWYPDRVLRVAPRDARWKGEDPHPKIDVNGAVIVLKGHIFHYTYKNISDHIQKMDRYASEAAREMQRVGRAFKLRTLLSHPLFRFLRDYVLKQGFRDGIPGLIIAGTTAFYVFLKYAKLWELQLTGDGENKN